MKKLLSSYLLLQLIAGCSDLTDSGQPFPLPTQFPLEVGNAWIYERHYYIDELDSFFLDTLYILGMHDDYYKYSWGPDYYFNLIKNNDGKLINYGMSYIGENPDTTFYTRPYIWAYYSEDTGYIDKNIYQDYSVYEDSIYIGIERGIRGLNYIYDAITESDIYKSVVTTKQYNIVDGFLEWQNYDYKTGELISRTKMIKKMKNFYPPGTNIMNKPGKSTGKSKNKSNLRSKHITPYEM